MRALLLWGGGFGGVCGGGAGADTTAANMAGTGGAGGKGGGGARLTEAGEKAIQTFLEIEQRIKDFAQKETQNLKFL